MLIKPEKQVAVLCDIENISPEHVLPLLLDKLSKDKIYAYPRKLIFSNGTQLKKNYLAKAIKDYRLEVICAYSPVGKNIADFRLYIEALELMFTKPELDGFCIVSGDADYGELVIKLSGEKKYVIGVGLKAKCNQEYTSLFDEFYYIEDILRPEENKTEPAPEVKEKPQKKGRKKLSKAKEEPKESKESTPEARTETMVKEKPEPEPAKKVQETKAPLKGDKEKDDAFYTELTLQITKVFASKKKRKVPEIFYSALVKELKRRSPELRMFQKISFEDITKCGFAILTKEEGKRETAYIQIQ